MDREQFLGYLPDERPPALKLFLYALQQVIVMFPATIAVALITGFQVSTTIFASGIATVCFVFITGGKIPMYYGSSFSYLTAVMSLVTSEAIQAKMSPEAVQQVLAWQAGEWPVMPTEAIQFAQFGIVMSGFVSIAAGLIVKYAGRKAVETILPPTITGSIAMVIGLTLASNALSDAMPQAAEGITGSNWVWAVSLITLLVTVLVARYAKGLISQLPLLFGVAAGLIASVIACAATGDWTLFRGISDEALASPFKLGNIFAVPAFSFPKVSWEAVLAIMPIAIATIPESTAHIYQLDIYVNDIAKKKGLGDQGLANMLPRNLIGDGLCDMISGVIGGPAGTNYGENISTMAIIRVFSVPVMFVAGIIAMIVACFTPLVKGIYGIPLAVIGGLEIYLFGAIAAQGIAIMIDAKVDMFSGKNIAVIAIIMIFALGGQYACGGNIPMFGIDVPCIAGAAIIGIIFNALMSIGEKKDHAAEAEQKAADA